MSGYSSKLEPAVFLKEVTFPSEEYTLHYIRVVWALDFIVILILIP